MRPAYNPDSVLKCNADKFFDLQRIDMFIVLVLMEMCGEFELDYCRRVIYTNAAHLHRDHCI